MGAVYVAEQLSTNKERALKLMRPELVANADMRRRFEQEAKVSARIASDHVVEIVGAGVDEKTGAPWLAMELLAGEGLDVRVERDGALDPETVRAMFEQLCHALAAAHALRIVHRDLKPENIFLAVARRPGGVPFTVKILDFGIAKTVADAESNVTATIGTPLWMAPEQTQRGAAITPAADVWPLGLVAFRLLTGRLYWRSAYDEAKSTGMLLREVLIEPLVPASERLQQYGISPLPAGFDAWFARCVAREPASRFSEAGEAYRELAVVLGAPGTARAVIGSSASPSTLATDPTAVLPDDINASLSAEPSGPTTGPLQASSTNSESSTQVLPTRPSPSGAPPGSGEQGPAAPTLVAGTTGGVALTGSVAPPAAPASPGSRVGIIVGGAVLITAMVTGVIALAIVRHQSNDPKPKHATKSSSSVESEKSSSPTAHSTIEPSPSATGTGQSESKCPCQGDRRCMLRHPIICPMPR
jgi:eukaryotic-like serine/threonine-protein kinase